LVAASNFPLLRNYPIASKLSSLFEDYLQRKISVQLLNDADAAIAAEVWGSGNKYKEYKNIAMVTLGTGIGLGLVLNGQLYQGSNGLVEGGHMIVTDRPASRRCQCGQIGCVEAYASASNTALRLKELDILSQSTATGGKNISPKVNKSVASPLKPSPNKAWTTTGRQKVIEGSLLGTPTKKDHSPSTPPDYTQEHSNSPSSQNTDSSLQSKDAFNRYFLKDVNATKVIEETAEYLAVMCINICRIVDPVSLSLYPISIIIIFIAT